MDCLLLGLVVALLEVDLGVEAVELQGEKRSFWISDPLKKSNFKKK